MPTTQTHGINFKHYLVALAGVFLVAVLRYSIGPLVGGAIPVVLFTLPVAVSAFYGGFMPAIFATLLGALASTYLFIQPYYSLRIDNSASAVTVLAFLIVGLVISLLGKKLKRVQSKEQEQARQLRMENERKDEFLAMLAHELRNPLAGISTAGQLLKYAHLDEKRLSATSDVITRQVGHMTKLVDDLLDVSRLTRGLVIIDKHPVDISAIVRGAVDQTESLFDAKGHRLLLQLLDEPTCVCGDATRLIQIVANLLGNAAKYTDKHGLITLSVRVDAGEVELKVEDNGTGLSPELLPRVFEPFVQAERSSDRSQGGLGLGLALVEKITHLHDGTVTAHSPGLGKGSTFTLRLPHWKQSAAFNDALLGKKEIRASEGKAAVQSLNLLVVDDNHDAAQGLGALMEQQGHTVVIAHNAKQALDFAHADEFDAFLLDIGLPEVDGYELARLLRLVPHVSEAEFIAVSGYGRPRDKELAKKAGFHHHFIKPVNTSALIEALKKIPARHER